MESILTSVKKMLGITEDYTHFDADIIMHINSVFSTLTQLGVGPSEGFAIEGADAEWSDFIGDATNLESIKSYIYMKVRLIFDSTSLTAAVISAYTETIKEFEWRLNVAAESK